MSKTDCVNCKYFHGYDGVGELWVGCTFGDFKGIRTQCTNFEKKVTTGDLLKKIHSLENENAKFKEENEQLKSRIAIFEEQEDEFEKYTAQTIQNMIANYRDDW